MRSRGLGMRVWSGGLFRMLTGLSTKRGVVIRASGKECKKMHFGSSWSLPTSKMLVSSTRYSF